MLLFPCFHQSQKVTSHLNSDHQSSEQHHPCPGTNLSGYHLPTFHGPVSYKNKVSAGKLHNKCIFRTGQPNSKHIPTFPCYQILSCTSEQQNRGLANSFAAETTFSPLLIPTLPHYTALSQTHGIQIPHAHPLGVMCKSKPTVFS